MNYLTLLCMTRDEDPRYLEELREWHVKMGVDSFLWLVHKPSIYPHPDFGDRVIKSVQGTFAEVIRQLIAAIKTCDSRWVATVDADEFLVCAKPLPEFLVEFERHDALVVHWLMFGSSGHKTKQFPVTQAYCRRARADYWLNGNVKSIVNPRVNLDSPSPHCFHQVAAVNEHHERYSPASGEPFTGDRIRMNHYWTRSREDWEEKCRRVSSTAPRSEAEWERNERDCVVFDERPMELHGYSEMMS